MALAFAQPGEIWVRITDSTRVRNQSVAAGVVMAVTPDEYVNLAAANRAVKVPAPKAEPAPEPKSEVKQEPVAPAAKPAKPAKTEKQK